MVYATHTRKLAGGQHTREERSGTTGVVSKPWPHTHTRILRDNHIPLTTARRAAVARHRHDERAQHQNSGWEMGQKKRQCGDPMALPDGIQGHPHALPHPQGPADASKHAHVREKLAPASWVSRLPLRAPLRPRLRPQGCQSPDLATQDPRLTCCCCVLARVGDWALVVLPLFLLLPASAALSNATRSMLGRQIAVYVRLATGDCAKQEMRLSGRGASERKATVFAESDGWSL